MALLKKILKRIAHFLKIFLPNTFVDRLSKYIRYFYHLLISLKTSKKPKLVLPEWKRSEKTTKPIVRVGFIGAGKYAQFHLEVLSKLSGVDITSILTTGKPRVKEVVDKFGINKTFDDISQFLNQDNLSHK